MKCKAAVCAVPFLAAALLAPRIARADTEFAEPPANHGPSERPEPSYSPAPDYVVVNPCDEDEPCGRRPRLDRSPVRFELGPQVVTTGAGLGYGLGTGLAFGEKSFGMRLGGAWFKGEERGTTVASTGEFMHHYTAETTLDLNKRGPIHPVLAMGLAFGHVSHPGASGWYGAGTARASLEYAMNLDRTDVRFGVGAMGVMVGPRDDELRSLGGYAVFDAKCVIGF